MTELDDTLKNMVELLRNHIGTEDVMVLIMAIILYLDMMMPNDAINTIANLTDHIQNVTGLGSDAPSDN